MTPMSDDSILSRRFDLAEVPSAGLDAEIAANEAQRAALAESYDLVRVDGLTATATLIPSGGGLTVSGRVVADIVQSCVVSLEPVAQHIDEVFSLRFVPAGSREAAKPGKEVVVDAADEADPPEIMEGTGVDLGALVEEIFVLAIDPYPRAPGAMLDVPPEEEEDDADSDSPFAVLRARREAGQ
jgi:uncharacterized metal-binding protein YceD (DUF177 family)